MSLVFNDTATYRGLVQIFEEECGFSVGDVSGNTERLKKFTAGVNLALDDYFAIGIQASGTWELDDSNHLKLSYIYTNLNINQRDYSFTVDEQSNLILDIYEILILPTATSTEYVPLNPYDENDHNFSMFINESSVSGVPEGYAKRGNTIFLGPAKPNYSATNGIKIGINREASYFTYTDTTKKPGVPGLHHKYFALKPAMDYARRNDLASYSRLEKEVEEFEGDELKGIKGKIAEYFGSREKDKKSDIKVLVERCD